MAIQLNNLNARRINADRNSVEIWLNERITVDVAREVNRIDEKQISRIKIIRPATYVFEGLDEGSEIDWGPRRIQSIRHTFYPTRGGIPETHGIVEDDVRVESDTEEKLHSTTNNPQVLIINFGAISIKSELTQSEIKKQNQTKILNWIRNGQFPNFDYDGYFVNPYEDPLEGTIHKNIVENLGTIFNAIEEYIRNNSHRFFLSRLRSNREEQFRDQWWAQEIPDGDPRLNYLKTVPHKDKAGIHLSGVREITFGQDGGGNTRNPALFPGNFTPEQYERLKNLLPDDRVCKVNGCYRNHAGSSFHYNPEEEMRAVGNGLCRYHQRKQNNEPEKTDEILNETNNDNDTFGILQKAQAALDSGNLEKIKQSIRELENIKANRKDEFIAYDGEQMLGLLVERKQSLEVNQTDENTNQGNNTDNGTEPEKEQDIPINNTNSSLQKAKNNAIQEITNALNQEPKLTTKHDLSEINRDWKKKINAADKENEIINIKEQVMVDIAAKRNNKKEAENITKNLETEGKDADQLKKQLEEVERSKGQESYEDNQAGIDNLKDELAKKVSEEEYSQIIADTIKNNLVKYDINEDELDTETKKNWQKLKNGEIKGKDQINEIEKQIAKNVGEKGSEKKLNKILQEAQQAIKSGNKNKIKAVKNKLYNFLASTNIYEKSLLAQRKNELNKSLRNLENYLDQKQTSSDQFPWKIVIPVALVLIIITFTLGVIIYRKRKKRLKS